MQSWIPEEEKDSLESILKALNDHFDDINWSNPDKMNEILTKNIPQTLKNDANVLSTRKISDSQNAKITLDKKLQ